MIVPFDVEHSPAEQRFHDEMMDSQKIALAAVALHDEAYSRGFKKGYRCGREYERGNFTMAYPILGFFLGVMTVVAIQVFMVW